MENNSTWSPSQRSRTTWDPEAWNPALTLLAALGAAFFFVVPGAAYIVAGVLLGSIDRHGAPKIPVDQLLFAQLATYAPLGAYLIVVLPRVARRSLHDLGLRTPSARQLAAAVLGTAAMWLVVALTAGLAAALTHRHDTENAVQVLQQLRTLPQQLLFFTIAIALAPMIEELTFRVFLFNAVTRYAPVWLAALVSGLIFGLVHSTSPGQIVTVGLPLAAGGIVLAYVYAATQCYWCNVLTHGLFNAINVIALLVFHASP